MNRRQAVGAIGLAVSAFATHSHAAASDPILAKADEVADRLHARLGLMIRDTETGRSWEKNADQLFPMASSFKAFAAAAVLAKVDAGKERLDRRIHFTSDRLVTYSPATEKRVGDGMTLGEICEAACTLSDNTAANLMLEALGGPTGLTAFMRGIGDPVTRLDRFETELNEGAPGDPRDTSSPRAVAASLDKLLLRNVLSVGSRNILKGWMIGNKAAGPLLRASLPANWQIADRTGAGGHGSRTIMAALWPPRRKPVVAAIYLTETQASLDDRNKAIAEIGSALVATIMR